MYRVSDFIEQPQGFTKAMTIVNNTTRTSTFVLRLYPNVANLLPAKTAKLAPEQAICALARLGQDFTYGEIRLDLPETARGHI